METNVTGIPSCQYNIEGDHNFQVVTTEKIFCTVCGISVTLVDAPPHT